MFVPVQVRELSVKELARKRREDRKKEKALLSGAGADGARKAAVRSIYSFYCIYLFSLKLFLKT